jgi:hypothetical protein
MPLPALVVEDGTGLSTANSYVTYLELVEYAYRVPDAYKAAWLQLDQYGIEQLGIWATALLDDWIYFLDTYRSFQAQSLNFPMFGLVDSFGIAIQHFPVPAFMKRATCQMALELSKGDRTVEPTRGIESASVGPLSVVFDKNHANGMRVIPRSVAVIVAPYGGRVRGSFGLKSIPIYRV